MNVIAPHVAEGRLQQLQRVDHHAVLGLHVCGYQHVREVSCIPDSIVGEPRADVICSPGMVAGIVSQWWVRTRYPRWFTKYKYVLLFR